MSGKYGDGRTGSQRQHHGYIPDELANGLRDAAENVRAAFDDRIGPRLGRRDIRAAILRLLAEEPMHGYQLIREIETRSKGVWKPTPGSVYPLLQLLVDEGLVRAEETDGKKDYSLTDDGKLDVDSGDPAPWETQSPRDAGCLTLLPKAGAKLAQAAVQVAHGGSVEQVHEAVAIIDDARRKLYAILAQE